jgi:hypothetical protein
MRPSIFIGSSAKAVDLAEAVKTNLADTAEGNVWRDGLFQLTRNTLQDLMLTSRRYDYAAFVLAPEDLASGQAALFCSRDSVLLELGMLLATMDASRCFFLLPSDLPGFDLPTELGGITGAPYRAAERAVPRACVGAACDQIRRVIAQHDHANLSGGWIQTWGMEKSGIKTNSSSPAVVRHMGDRLRAQLTCENVDFALEGTLRHGRITGSWGTLDGQESHFGSFQLNVDPRGLEMSGMWLGWNREWRIRTGEWRWLKST